MSELMQSVDEREEVFGINVWHPRSPECSPGSKSKSAQ